MEISTETLTTFIKKCDAICEVYDNHDLQNSFNNFVNGINTIIEEKIDEKILNEKIDALYFYYRDELVKAKAECDYILYYFKYHEPSFSIEGENIVETMEYYSDQLDFHLLKVKGETQVLENKLGLSYFKPNNLNEKLITRRKKSYDFNTELDEFQTAFFFQILYDQKIINPEFKKDVAAPVHVLTGYSEEGIRQKLSNTALNSSQINGLIKHVKAILTTVENLRK